jgi:hypothetical protein
LIAAGAAIFRPRGEAQPPEPALPRVADLLPPTTAATAEPAPRPVEPPTPLDAIARPETSTPPAAASAPPPSPSVEERERERRVQDLRARIPPALDAARLDEAAGLLAELREAAPGDADLPAWSRRVEEARARAARVTELAAAIPAAMSAGDWRGAQGLLAQLGTIAPQHPRRAEWSAAVDDQLAVRDLLDRYRGAQEALDAGAYHVLWVELGDDDLQKIRRAYADIRAQTVRLDGPDVRIDGDAAVARFREIRSIDLRAGGRHAAESVTVLALRRSGNGWKIASRATEP